MRGKDGQFAVDAVHRGIVQISNGLCCLFSVVHLD